MRLNIGIIFKLAFLVLCFERSSAQNTEGLFLNANDFLRQKLSYEISDSEHFHIRMHESFYKPYVDIKNKRSNFQLSKDSLFGFRDRSGVCYRFYHEVVYTILNPDEKILLYQRSVYGGDRNTPVTYRYYFSMSADDVIRPFEYEDLKSATLDNSVFQLLLEGYRSNISALLLYDDVQDARRINWLYQLSLNTK